MMYHIIMVNVENARTIAILSLAMLGFCTPVHACQFHGEFGMQRFNPFQAKPYDNSSSWGASLNQNRKMSPMLKQQDSDTEPVEETWNDRPQSDEQQMLTSDTAADKTLFH